jgi:hypothetical protein
VKDNPYILKEVRLSEGTIKYFEKIKADIETTSNIIQISELELKWTAEILSMFKIEEDIRAISIYDLRLMLDNDGPIPTLKVFKFFNQKWKEIWKFSGQYALDLYSRVDNKNIIKREM